MSVGIDPEFFVVDGGNRLIPAEHILFDLRDDLSIDGAALEINPHPSSCLIAFQGNTRELLRYAYFQMRVLRAQGQICPNARLSFAPAVSVRKSDLSLRSLESFGCNPAYIFPSPHDSTPVESTINVDPLSMPHRSAGFHIHTSISDLNHLQVRLMVADYMLGLTDVLMSRRMGWSQQAYIRRQKLGYGLPTEHRVTPRDNYSTVEYRTMSAWPLMHPIWHYWAISAWRYICSRMPIQTVHQFLGAAPDYTEVADAIMSIGTVRTTTALLRASITAMKNAVKASDRNISTGNDSMAPDNLDNLRKILFTPSGYKHKQLGYSFEVAWFHQGRRDFKRNRDLYGRPRRRKYTEYPVRNEMHITAHERGRFVSFPTGGKEIAESIGRQA